MLPQEFKLINIIVKDHQKTLFAVENTSAYYCPYCHSENVRKYGSRVVSIRDVPDPLPTKILLQRQRYSCGDCKKVFYTSTPNILQEHRITSRLYEYLKLLHMDCTYAQISAIVDIPVPTLRKILKNKT